MVLERKFSGYKEEADSWITLATGEYCPESEYGFYIV
jgi:hypothetical protein